MSRTRHGEHPLTRLKGTKFDEPSRQLLVRALNDPHYLVWVEKFDCLYFEQTVGDGGHWTDICSACGRTLQDEHAVLKQWEGVKNE